MLRDPFALRADAVDLGEDFGQGNQALHGARGLGRRGLLGAVREVFDAMHHTDRQRLAARRAQAVMRAGLCGGEADPAVAVPVQMVLALLGKELERAFVPHPGLQRPAEREVVQVGVEDAHLPSELLR